MAFPPKNFYSVDTNSKNKKKLLRNDLAEIGRSMLRPYKDLATIANTR